MKTLVNQRWFAAADLGLVLVAIVLWASGLSWQPLLVVLLPWALRLMTGRFPFRSTAFDLAIALFLISAAIGIWASYDRQGAWEKFWLLIAAVALFYAMAGQPRRALWPLAGVLGLTGLGVGVYFLLSHDWAQFPAKLAALNTIVIGWTDIRPAVNLPPLPPNVAASLMSITAPFLVAWGVHSWRQAQRGPAILSAIATMVVAGLIFASTSRGAWLALAAAASLVFLLISARWLAGRTGASVRVVAFGLSGAVLVLVLVAALSYAGGPVALLDRLPGPTNATGRLELSQHTLSLIADFPITGGGLGSFPGLYSQYIRVIPFFFLPNGHNILLDMALEQGPLGTAALLTTFGGSFILLARGSAAQPQLALLYAAITASLVVMLVHGQVEDTVYGSPALPFLLVLPGMAVAAGLPVEETEGALTVLAPVRIGAITLLIAAAILLGWLLASGQDLRSLWAANMGALQMARVELEGWPTGKWVEEFDVTRLQPARALFEKALEEGGNRTAWHRLGLMAMLGRDYETAVAHLEAADQLGGHHRGIRKNLAYSYVWTGRFEDARPLLVELDEAQQELGVYGWWWETQNRPELADQSTLMAEWLGSAREQKQQ